MAGEITSTVVAKWLFVAVWSILGGVVNMLIERRKGKTMSTKDEAILTFISAFIGSLWCLAAMTYSPGNTILAALAGGCGGLMSLEGVAMVASIVQKKLSK